MTDFSRLCYFCGVGETKVPHPLFPPPLPRKETDTMMDHRKEMLIHCIVQQLQKMNVETLREAYTAVSRISDRGKELFE